MPWIRVDPTDLHGPKLGVVSLDAVGLYFLLKGFVTEHATDGVVTAAVWERRFAGLDPARETLLELLDAELVVDLSEDPDHKAGDLRVLPLNGWAAPQVGESDG